MKRHHLHLRPFVKRLRRELDRLTRHYDPGDARTPFDYELDECDRLINALDDFSESMGWQNASRVYLPSERQLDVRLDRSSTPA